MATIDRLDKEGNVLGSRLGYWEMQALRQQNILEAVRDESASVERLVHQYAVAQRGLRLAFHYGATESDALTFLNLQGDIRERLRQAPSQEVAEAVAHLVLSSEISQAG